MPHTWTRPTSKAKLSSYNLVSQLLVQHIPQALERMSKFLKPQCLQLLLYSTPPATVSLHNILSAILSTVLKSTDIMGSRDGVSSAGSGRSHSSNKHVDSPFVDHWGGYTWDDGAHQWIYDGCNGIYPPSRHDALPPDGLPFNGRNPFSDSYGNYFTPDENDNVYPSDEYGRYRSKSPEGPSAYWSKSLPIREIGSNRRPRTVSPNTESKCLLNSRCTSYKQER